MSNISPEIRKLVNTLNSQRVVSDGEMEELLQAILAILAENKKSVESLNAETKEQLEEAKNYLTGEHERILEVINSGLIKSKAEVEKATREQNDRAFKHLQTLISQIKMPRDGATGQPGKDADETAIVEKVLEKIKLPENKDYVLTADDVRDRINELGDEDKDKVFTLLGSKQITDIKGTIEQRFADALNRIRLTRGVKSIIAGTNITISVDDNGNVTINSSGSGGGGTAPGATGATGPQGPQGTQGTQGSQGSLGATGATGATGADGARGSQGSQGTQGSLGATGATGATGPQGSQGSQGSLGATGATGIPADSFIWNYSAATGATAPTGGNFRWNASGASNTTSIYISELSTAAIDVSAWLARLTLSTNTSGTAVLYIRKASDPTVFAVFSVTALADNGSWDTVTVTHVTSNGTFAGGDQCYVTFNEVGNKGGTGVQGTQGSQGSLGATGATGAQGTQGTQGSIGVQGPQGTQGTQGSLGPTGATGATGAQGTQGSQGSASTVTGPTGPQGTQGSIGSIGVQGATGPTGGTGFVSPRVTATASTLSPTPNADTTDLYILTAQAGTAAFQASSGTPVDGQKLIIKLNATGATRNITWTGGTGGYTAGGVVMPLTVSVSKIVTIGFIYDTSNSVNRWMCVALSTQI